MADKVRAFNRKDIDFTKQYMFFGEQPNVARYDIQRYPIFEKLIETHHGFFWTPQEVNLTQDSIDYKNLADLKNGEPSKFAWIKINSDKSNLNENKVKKEIEYILISN